MRYSLTLAAFAAGALAVPYKRDVVTHVDYAYVTDIVTVTAGDLPEATTKPYHFPHGHASSSKVVEQVYTTQAPATYQAPASTSEAEPTTQPASTYVAPASTAPVYSSSAASAAATLEPYQQTVVDHHNMHRSNHSAENIEWSSDLAASAQQIAETCIYAHNTEVAGGGYGQNIAAGVEPANISAVITDLFYNGEEPIFANAGLYGQENPDMTQFELWGHFTQIVWKATTHVGCFTQYCSNGLANVGTGVSPYFTVCNYGSPGNYAGEYATNVGSPKGDATANWNTNEAGSY